MSPRKKPPVLPRAKPMPPHVEEIMGDLRSCAQEIEDDNDGGIGEVAMAELAQHMAGKIRLLDARLRSLLTVDEVRRALARRRDLCDPGCPGWGIFESNDRTEIERCDECCRYLHADAGILLIDDEMAQLPEAVEALSEALGGDPVYRCRCTWVGGDPDMRRGRAFCPACWHHDKKRVRVQIETPTNDPRTMKGHANG